jgi:hypothetical protein
MISSIEFNRLFSKNIFYVLLKESKKDLKGNVDLEGNVLTNGLNATAIQIDELSKNYVGGGYTFYDIQNIPFFFEENQFVCKATVPNATNVPVLQHTIERDKTNAQVYKTNAIMIDLETKIRLEEWEAWLNADFCKMAVKKNGFSMSCVANQTPELCIVAIENGGSLKYIKKELITPELCLMAVNRLGPNIGFVPDEIITDELRKMAIKQDFFSIMYIPQKDRTPELCEFIVRNNGYNLAMLHECHRTKDICDIAFQNNVRAFQFIPRDFITQEICEAYINSRSEYWNEGLKNVPKKFITQEMCETAVKQHAGDFEFVPQRFITKEMCETAVKRDGNLIRFVPECFLTLELCKLAVENDRSSHYLVPLQYKVECENHILEFYGK